MAGDRCAYIHVKVGARKKELRKLKGGRKE